MGGEKKFTVKTYSLLLALVVFCSVIGCAGGGSGGTGILPTAGFLRNADQKPLSDISITVETLGSSSTAVSDSEGSYTLDTVNREGDEEIKFIFEGDGMDASFVVSILPAQASDLTAFWEVQDNNTVRPLRYEFTLENGEDRIIVFD